MTTEQVEATAPGNYVPTNPFGNRLSGPATVAGHRMTALFELDGQPLVVTEISLDDFDTEPGDKFAHDLAALEEKYGRPDSLVTKPPLPASTFPPDRTATFIFSNAYEIVITSVVGQVSIGYWPVPAPVTPPTKSF